jgi:hypothetical protein
MNALVSDIHGVRCRSITWVAIPPYAARRGWVGPVFSCPAERLAGGRELPGSHSRRSKRTAHLSATLPTTGLFADKPIDSGAHLFL